MTQNFQQRSQAEAELIRRVWKEEDLAAKLEESPTAIYREALEAAGGSLSEGTEIKVVKETDETLFLVVPNGSTDAKAPELDERSTRGDIEAAILIRAMSDPAAKEALIADPRGVFEAELGRAHQSAELPEDLAIKVVQESDNVLYFRLPEAPTVGSGELTESELEAAAGGVVAVGAVVLMGVVVGAAVAAVLVEHNY